MQLQNQIILASQSNARKELLKQLGIKNFKIISHDIDETIYEIRSSVSSSVLNISYLKAESVKEKYKDNKNIIISADTIVYRANKIFQKPKSKEEVRSHLKNLSSRKHLVYGGICVISPKGEVYKKLVKTEVFFHKIFNTDLTSQILEDGLGKAGGYAIQNLGIRFVKKIKGCYTNIVGISIPELYKILKNLNLI